MKKSVSHLLYPIIMMIAAMNFTISCTDEPETEKQAELPVLEDLTVSVGQTGTIDFNAPLAWTISSDKEWFALGGEQGETSGEAGQQSVPYTVTDQDADFEKTTEANVRIVFSDDRYITFKVTRGTLDRTMTITSDEEGTTPIESSIRLSTDNIDEIHCYTFYVKANYDWYVDLSQTSDWLLLRTIGGALTGSAGETYEIPIYVDINRAPIEEAEGAIVLKSDDEIETETVNVTFEGFGTDYWKIMQVKDNGTSSQDIELPQNGFSFTKDGFLTNLYGEATEDEEITIRLRAGKEHVFIVTTADAWWDYGSTTGLKCHYACPYTDAIGNFDWLNITQNETTETGEGTLLTSSYTISVSENVPPMEIFSSMYSWMGRDRKAQIYCVPLDMLETSYDADASRIYNGRIQNDLTTKIDGTYTLNDEFKDYLAFEVTQIGEPDDVEYPVITNTLPWDSNGELSDLGQGNYKYTGNTSRKFPINLEVQFPQKYTDVTVKNKIDKPEGHEGSNPYSFSDCEWLTFDLTLSEGSTYLFYVQPLQNTTGESRSYTIVFIDGTGTEIGSLLVEQPA